MGNEAYRVSQFEAEEKIATLARTGGGGATIAKTKNGIVIGIWDKKLNMVKYDKEGKASEGGVQNSGDCAMNVEKVQNILLKAGY